MILSLKSISSLSPLLESFTSAVSFFPSVASGLYDSLILSVSSTFNSLSLNPFWMNLDKRLIASDKDLALPMTSSLTSGSYVTLLVFLFSSRVRPQAVMIFLIRSSEFVISTSSSSVFDIASSILSDNLFVSM